MRHNPTEVSAHDGTEAKAIAALAWAAAGIQTHTDDASGRKWLVIPDGVGSVVIEEITEPGDANPGRLAAKVVISEPTSLVEYAKRFTTETGVLFADHTVSTIVAALDYHNPSVSHDGVVDDPSATHNEHRATLALQHSEEWSVWTGADGKMMSQLDFARFLEDNAPDVFAPSGADLLEIARDFHAVRKADFRQIVRTNSDNERIEFTDSTEGKVNTAAGAVEVPTHFVIRIPVYFGEPAVEMRAAFRWGVRENVLSLGVKLIRREHVRQAEFRRIVTDMAERTGFPAFFGKMG